LLFRVQCSREMEGDERGVKREREEEKGKRDNERERKRDRSDKEKLGNG